MSRTAILTSGANLSIAMHQYRETIAADICIHLKLIFAVEGRFNNDNSDSEPNIFSFQKKLLGMKGDVGTS